jgi:hypothetical protein
VADVTRHRKAAVERVLDGKGVAAMQARRAAFDNTGVEHEAVRTLIDKVAKHAYKVTDEDVAAAKRAVSEDEVFELVVCAAIGQATRQIDAALAVIAKVDK